MKRSLMRLFSGLAAAAVALAGVPVLAAGQDCAVRVERGTLSITLNGQTVTSPASPPVKLEFLSGPGGVSAVLATLAGPRTFPLGDCERLDIQGNIDILNLGQALDPGVTADVGAQVGKFIVRGGGSVTLTGKAENMNLAGRADVTVGKGASVGTLTVTSAAAALKAETGAKIERTYSSEPGARLTGVGSVAQIPAWDASYMPETGSTSSSTGSRSGPSSGSTASPPSGTQSPGDSDVSITGVFPSRGKVRVELSRGISLNASAFFVSCPAGKDMTILSAAPADAGGRVYELTTAFYADNTYLMEITLPSGRKITKEFVTNGNAPQITFPEVTRTDAQNLEFSFQSDDDGTLYYMAVPNLARAAVGTAAPSSAAELEQKGAQAPVQVHRNTVAIGGLQAGVPYTLYYAVEDSLGGAPVMQAPVAVPASADETPGGSGITITAQNVTDDHFRVILSEPCALTLEAFSATCPKGDIALGRAETDDNQTYEIYLAYGDHMFSYTTYRVTVAFPNGETAQGSFYADNWGPELTVVKVARTGPDTAVMEFKSDEAGQFWYGTCASRQTEDKPKPAEARRQGTQKALNAGLNEVTVTGIPADHHAIFLVAEDAGGNFSTFTTSGEIPDDVSEPAPQPENAIESITQLANASSPACTRIQVKLEQAVDRGHLGLSSPVSAEPITVTPITASTSTIPRVWGVSPSEPGLEPTKDFTVQFSGLLPAGTYRLNIHLPDGKLKKEFSVAD